MVEREKGTPNETAPKKQERKERFSSWFFYDSFKEAVKQTEEFGLSLWEFNLFCLQHYPGMANLGLSKETGNLSMLQVAECFRVGYGMIRRMVVEPKLGIPELVGAKVKGNYRFPASGIVLHHNVGVWHDQEFNEGERRRAVREGDLSVLPAFEFAESPPISLPRMWEAFVQEKLGEIPEGCSWQALVDLSLN